MLKCAMTLVDRERNMFTCANTFQGLDAIEYTNMRYLTREMTAEFYALKGMLLAQLSKFQTRDLLVVGYTKNDDL